jgi:uncharacterized protein YjbJ (UPF0337 family)
MDWERIEHDWKNFKDSAKKQWSRLSDVTLDGTLGSRDSLASSLQLAYGISKEETERQLAAWQSLQVEKR